MTVILFFIIAIIVACVLVLKTIGMEPDHKTAIWIPVFVVLVLMIILVNVIGIAGAMRMVALLAKNN